MKKGLLKFSALALSLLFVVTGCQKHQHQWSSTYEHDNDKHWQTCASCEEHNNEGAHTFTEKVTTPATHTATGVKTYTCSVCGYSKTETIAKTTEHSYTILKHNDETHWYECECGEKQTAVAHTWGELVVIEPATYEAAGSGKYTCTVCGQEKTVVLDQLVAPATGAKGHEISVSKALELLAGETVEAGATTAAEYYVEGIITYAKKSTKEETINDFNMDVADPTDPSKKIQSYYAVTAADVDVTKIVVGNKVRVGGLITNYRGTTWEWTSTGSLYYVEELSHEVTLGAHEHATVSGLEATYVSGATVTFTVVADEGYAVKQVLVDGKGVTPVEGVYSFAMGNGATIVVETEENNVSLVPAGQTVAQDLLFKTNFETYAAEWGSGYGNHTMALSELGSDKFAGSVEIVGCNKQAATSAIHDMPVVNGKNSTVTIAINKYAIREVEFNLAAWATSKKFNDIHIEASTDGTNFVAVTESAIAEGSALPAEGLKVSAKLASDVVAVRLVIVSANTGSNVQLGIADATIKVGNLGEELVHVHSATHVPAVAAGCEAAGNIEYWHCAECGKYFSDEALANEITLDATVVAAKGHTLVKVEAKDPTYLEGGNVAHYKCSECGATFADEAGLQPIRDVAIAALGIKPTASADRFVKVSWNAAPADVYPSVRLIDLNNQNWNGEGFVIRVKNNTGVDTPLDMQINDVAANRSFLVNTNCAPYLIDLEGNWRRGELVRAWGNYVMLPANFDGWMFFDYNEMVNRADFGAAFDKTINVWGLFVIINPHYDAYAVVEFGAIQVLRDGQFVTVLDPKTGCCDEWSSKVMKDYEPDFINFDFLGEHDYVHHDAVEATYTETGMAEYYECSNCHWFFNADKQPVVYDSLITPVKVDPHATSDMLIYDLTGKVSADLQDDVEVKKWTDAGWADTQASIEKGKNQKDEDAIVLKAWVNGTVFRYSFPYSTDKYYKSVKFSANANGIATMKVQLMNSKDGFYTTYDLGTLFGGNCDYTIAFTDSAWVITYGDYKVSFAQAKAAGYINYNDETEMIPQFDLFNLIIGGYKDGGPDSNITITDLRFGFEGDTTERVEHEIPNANVVLDFSDGAGSDKYKGANWYERVYTDKWSDWGAVTQMNSRSLNGDKNANAYCDTMTRQYAYNPAEEIGNVKYVEAKLGNYWSNAAAGTIKIKVSLIDVKGATHYLLGGASGSTNEWYLLENVTSPQAYAIQAKVDLPETIEVDYIVITTKMASGQAYLYMDDIKLLAENPTPIVVTYDPIDFTEDFESYGSLPANVTKTVSNIYFKNVAGAGADGSAKYLSVYTRGGNGMVYTLANPGKADKVTVTMKNDFASYNVATDVQIDIIGLDGAVVGAEKVTLEAGAAWTAFEVELTEAQSVVTKVICTFSPQGATADCYCYVDNIIVK